MLTPTSTSWFEPSGWDRLRRILHGHVASGTVPGLVFAAARGERTEVVGVGRSGPEGPDMAPDSIFRVASLTKPVVAVATLMLLEECRLRLDDPIADFLPELADRPVLRRPDAELDDTEPAERPVTVRDVLTYRCGDGIVMAAPDSTPWLRAISERKVCTAPPQPDTVPDVDIWLRRLGEVPLLEQPGTEWRYHTPGDLLGVLVARASGRPLPDFLDERVFGPLGMVDTGFFTPLDKVDRFVPQWEMRPGGPVMVDNPATGQWSRPPAFPAGSGGLVSTAPDYARFARMLLQGGQFDGRRLLSSNSVAAMTTPALTDHQLRPGSDARFFLDGQNWGLGLQVGVARAQLYDTPGRYGWTGGLGSSWFNDPDRHLFGVLLTPTSWVSPRLPVEQADFWTALYSALP